MENPVSTCVSKRIAGTREVVAYESNAIPVSREQQSTVRPGFEILVSKTGANVVAKQSKLCRLGLTESPHFKYLEIEITQKAEFRTFHQSSNRRFLSEVLEKNPIFRSLKSVRNINYIKIIESFVNFIMNWIYHRNISYI